MSRLTFERLAFTVQALPSLAAGPGGAVAVLRNGVVLESHAWGYADLERRIPFSARTVVPACSITKQFLCAALLSRVGDPERLDGYVGEWLPRFRDRLPSARQLCDNQSGLRDYWAQTVLCGGMPDGELRPHQAMEIISRTETGHFAPGTHYSYANPNFRILKGALEAFAGEGVETLLENAVFGPASMETAQFQPETACLPGSASGYEGTPDTGFIRAVNRIYWAGDAGVCLSLDDMIAWESFIDATRDDPAGLYNRLSAPPRFACGEPASYGFGLLHGARNGLRFTEHGGGLRGWSLHRLHCAEEQLSIIVMLNHRAVSARKLALHLLDSMIGHSAAPSATLPSGWKGTYFGEATGLLLDIWENDAGKPLVRFEAGAEDLSFRGDTFGASENLSLRRDADTILLDIPRDNLSERFLPVHGEPMHDVEGVYHSSELNTRFSCGFSGAVLYGAFDGLLGAGPMHPLLPVGGDIWRMSCPRAMDAAAPGDWTVRFLRNSSGRISGFTIGCWLSRNNQFVREGRVSIL